MHYTYLYLVRVQLHFLNLCLVGSENYYYIKKATFIIILNITYLFTKTKVIELKYILCLK